MGFADILSDCVLDGLTCEDKNEATFQQRLVAKKRELVRHLPAHPAEGARTRGSSSWGTRACSRHDPSNSYRNLLFADDQRWMNAKADELDEMLRAAARDSGANVEFVDPREAFAGHGIGGADPWFNDLSFQANGFSPVNPGSFHPNAAGQRALARLVQEQLGHP